MRYHNITKLDMLNGSGLRVVLWVSHCEHQCINCQNPQTWDSMGGIPFDLAAKEEIFAELKKEEVQGITFSGGDPLSTINREEILELAKEIKLKFPNKNIWLYTGYEWEEICKLNGIENIDVLVDGKFFECLSVPSPKWRGSSNQRVISVQESLKQNKVVLSKHN
ncbi:anaerobic ribonucleoside-triphosphate reductase activating protein [Clostridium perfringens]|uniref:anaerobic ribonucleoside-triphosphate reductase activating protein n=1 Tax=Clostridium perfringens TaxID=1502 RepID=UPI00374A675A